MLLLLSVSCATGSTAPQPGPTPASWERVAGESFENKGIARVERVGKQWALTVHCNGTYTTYLDPTSLDLDRYGRGFVRARYRYVERTIPDPRCTLAPCANITERRISLQELTVVNATTDDAAQSARECRTTLPE